MTTIVLIDAPRKWVKLADHRLFNMPTSVVLYKQAEGPVLDTYFKYSGGKIDCVVSIMIDGMVNSIWCRLPTYNNELIVMEKKVYKILSTNRRSSNGITRDNVLSMCHHMLSRQVPVSIWGNPSVRYIWWMDVGLTVHVDGI